MGNDSFDERDALYGFIREIGRAFAGARVSNLEYLEDGVGRVTLDCENLAATLDFLRQLRTLQAMTATDRTARTEELIFGKETSNGASAPIDDHLAVLESTLELTRSVRNLLAALIEHPRLWRSPAVLNGE